MINIAIFASGSGTNAQRIIEYFKDDSEVNICRIFCNNPSAFVLQRAEKLNIPSLLFSKDDFYAEGIVADTLQSDRTDWIILAGFLWLIPQFLINRYPDRIVNIHPALLPKYGGKGMYGNRVHKAVIENGEDKSGITIHFVNQNYDEGQIIFQAKCDVHVKDTTQSLALKIHELEYKHFPEVIEELIKMAD
ncbi:MAG: phosphoribosylglycinamide formyltransferase [Bacteroidales bacterium]|nr:phosphoribosylglycinamide formyltransferase [Bacteroidales bacterium]